MPLPRFHHRIDHWLFAATGLLTVVLLFGIFAFLLLAAIGTFEHVGVGEFLFGGSWNPTAYSKAEWGIVPLLVGTGIISLLSMLISAPLGLAVAIYLSELASTRTREAVKPVLEMIAAIPSVVLGLLGLLFFAPIIARLLGLSNGLNALTASLLVGITTLPTVASICEDALSSVSKRHREASLALGATKWETIRKAVIPAAVSGIVAGVMLGLGRAIGETMIVLMVSGNSLAMPDSVLDPVRPMTATIAIEIKEAVTGSTHWHSLFAIGLVLFVLTFAINLAADVLIHKRNRS